MGSAQSDFFQVALKDCRFAPEAYEFLAASMQYTQQMLGRSPPERPEQDRSPPPPECHVSGRELLEGIRRFALDQFGMLGGVVFRSWGIQSTSDFGAMVYRLIDAGLWYCSPNDQREDFDNVYDFETEFEEKYRIEWEEL